MKSILLVEDAPAVREALTDTLEESGYSVTAVESGSEALIALQQGSFDLLLSDYLMPHMKGDEVAHLARRARPELKVIFLTAYAEFLSLTGKLAGEMLVTKPVSLADLVGKVEASLSSSSAGATNRASL